jgi:hypothetical protein
VSTRIAFLVAGVVATTPAIVKADDYASDRESCYNLGDRSPPCATDGSDVVGYHHCPWYGSWGSNLLDPYLYLDLGMNVRHFGAHSGPVLAARSSTPGGTSSGGGDMALTYDERIGYGIAHGLYAAIDFELGNFADTDPTRTNTRDVVLDGLASLGVRGGIGPLALSVELSGGAMVSSYPTQADMKTDGLLEARARVDVWLAPWFTIGGSVGASLIEEGSWMAGLYLGFHTWAYAGDR